MERGGDAPITTWKSKELAKIGTAEEAEISSFRSDGALRNPVTIWAVRHGDDQVRSVYGCTSAWFRGTQVHHEGHIRATSVDKDVTFVEADPDINDQIDAAYRIKYRRLEKHEQNQFQHSGSRLPRAGFADLFPPKYRG